MKIKIVDARKFKVLNFFTNQFHQHCFKDLKENLLIT